MHLIVRYSIHLVPALAAFCLGRFTAEPLPLIEAADRQTAAPGGLDVRIAAVPQNLPAVAQTHPPSETSYPAALAAQLAGIRGVRERTEYISQTLLRLAAEAPEEALPFAAALPPGPWRTPALIQSLEILATAGQARNALAEAARLVPASELDAARLSIAAGWARYAPAEAMEWTVTLADDALRASAAETIVSAWAASDPADALRWLDSRPDMVPDDHMIRSVSAAWASFDPAAALTWAQSQAAANPGAPNPVFTVYQEWSDSDPAAAGTALLREDPAIQREAVAVLIRSWAEAVPAEAALWVSRLSDPSVRQSAIAVLNQVQSNSQALPGD